MGYYLSERIDFRRHNEESRAVWEAYHARRPIRVPVILGINPRVLILNPELNPLGITFKDYSEDPDLMARTQLETQHYIRRNMLQDSEMGLPEEGWTIGVDLQNYYEAGWFGCEVEYRDGQVPDTRPILFDDDKLMLFDRGVPDPFTGGVMARHWRFFEHMKSNMASYSHSGLPVIGVNPAATGTDGPFTIAVSLRGGTEMCLDLYQDPDYARELLRYITEATVLRIKAYRKALGHDPRPEVWGFADDAIEMLSVEMYREFVLPWHKTLVRELAGAGPHGIHLCGDVGRLMPVLKEELNIDAWDAGFPVDYGGMRGILGPDVQIATGPTVATLLSGTPEQVEAESKSILQSGIMEGGRFLLREANNLSPCTPVENVAAMYRAAKRYGTYESQ